MRRQYLVAAAISLLAIAFPAAGCGDSNSDEAESGPFRLGLEAPLSGEQSGLGEGMLKGAELAAAELNEEEGILAREVEVVPIDDAADPATGVRAAEEAIEEGLDGVIGPYNSGVGVKTLPLYIDAGLVPIRLTSDVSTDGLGYTLQPMSFQIAPVASRALTDWLGAKSVAIAYDPTQNYTRSVSSELKTGLEEAGVEVTAYSKVKPGKSSYTAELEELDAAEPDVIYAAVYYPEGGLIAKEMKAGDFGAKCVADYASYDTGYVETAGIAAARSCPVVGVPAPEDFAGAAEKVDAFREMFDQAPGTWSPYTYDSVYFLGDGLDEAGETTAEGLMDALDSVDGWKGWTGTVTIEPDRGYRQPATVVIAETDAEGVLHVGESWAKAVGAPYE